MSEKEGTHSKEEAHLWWHESLGNKSQHLLQIGEAVLYGIYSRDKAARNPRKQQQRSGPYSRTAVRPGHDFLGRRILVFISIYCSWFGDRTAEFGTFSHEFAGSEINVVICVAED